MKKFSLIILVIAMASVPFADDFDDMFSEDAFADVDIESTETNSAFSLAHEFGSKVVYNYNSDESNPLEETYSGVTASAFYYRPSFNYQPNDIFSLNGEFNVSTDTVFWLREDTGWSDEDIKVRQFQFDVNELVGQVRLGEWQINSGVQSVTLGLADALSVSNVLYASNLATPGVNDTGVVVIPAWTTVINGSVSGVRVKAGSVHTHELNTLPTTGSDFDTGEVAGLTAMLAAANLEIEAEALALENMAWFASFSGVTGSLDWQVNGISQLAHSPVLEMKVGNAGPVPSEITYPRINTASAAVSYVVGPFLLKAESAFANGLQAQDTALVMQDYQRVAGVVGFDYTNNFMGRLIAEIQYGEILDYDALSLAKADESSVQWAAMYSKSLLREQLEISAQLMGFGIDGKGGRLQGIGVEYSVSDELTIGARLIDYVDGSYSFFNGADDRDRMIVTLNYQF